MKTQKKTISNKELLASLRKDPEYRVAEKELESKAILARNILRYRVKQGITQDKLAEMAGMRQPRIADMESMKGNPTLETLEKVALVLGVTPAELLSGPTPEAPKKVAQPPKREVGSLMSLLQFTTVLRYEGEARTHAKTHSLNRPVPFIESAHSWHRKRFVH
jgi:transcriptional regulator with XRE-family HTH domain